MAEAAPSPSVSVQVVQALIARELVHGFGLSERDAAARLGLVPSSVSQYLSGKRLGPTLSAYLGNDDARRIALRAAQQIIAAPGGPGVVLSAAMQLSERFRRSAPPSATLLPDGLGPELRRKIPRWLRNRIAGEQSAVAECMRLAQRSRDELTRAVFRQIASDSLRHAEIVASLAAYLDRGVAQSEPTGISRSDVEHLIRREREAEATSEIELGPKLGGVMRILWDSMESDERKHEKLLLQLLEGRWVRRERSRRPTRPRDRSPVRSTAEPRRRRRSAR